MSRRSQIVWTIVIAASLGLQVLAAVLGAGYAELAGVRDARGNVLGFNDLVTLDHTRMMFAYASVKQTFRAAGWYFSLCIVAHVGGMVVIWVCRNRWWRRTWYFGVQSVLFPIAWIPISWFLPVATVMELLAGFDGEAIADAPVNLFCTHVSWSMISIGLVIAGFWETDRPSNTVRWAGRLDRELDSEHRQNYSSQATGSTRHAH